MARESLQGVWGAPVVPRGRRGSPWFAVAPMGAEGTMLGAFQAECKSLDPVPPLKKEKDVGHDCNLNKECRSPSQTKIKERAGHDGNQSRESEH